MTSRLRKLHLQYACHNLQAPLLPGNLFKGTRSKTIERCDGYRSRMKLMLLELISTCRSAQETRREVLARRGTDDVFATKGFPTFQHGNTVHESRLRR